MVPPATTSVAVLARPRLLTILRRRFEVGVVAVVAGAGFGKTTLLRQAVADNLANPRGVDVSVTCGPADAQVSRLAERLAPALGLDPSSIRGDAALGVLCGALAENAAVPICLLLDDVHDVPADSPGGRLLRALLARAPDNAHFVVASREPVPGLARRRAHDDVVEIDERTMRFTDDEVERAGRAHSGDVRAASDLGGWPALVGLALSFGSAAAREFAREEVLDALDRPRQRALAALAAVGGGSRTLCAAVVESVVDGMLSLDEVIAGLPLVVADDATVEPHALWSRLLADVLTEDERLAVCRLAAARCLAEGDTARGFDLSVAIDDVDGARDAIRGACSRGYAAMPRDVLSDWLDRLPAPLRAEPEGFLLAGIAARASDPFGVETRDLLDRARIGFRERGDVAAEVATSSEYVFVLRARGEIGPIGAVMERAFALEAEGHEVARGACQLARGLIADVIGNDSAALEELARIDPGAISPEWQVVADFLMMMTAYGAGRADEVHAAAQRCARGAGASYAARELILPGANWLIGRTADVPSVLPPLPPAAQATPNDLLWAGFATATIACARGAVDDARAALAIVESALGTDALPFLAATVAGCGATVDVAAGDEDAATARLGELLDSQSAANPGVDRGLRFAFVVSYVLSPQLRVRWEEAEFGPLHERNRTIGRAVMAVRDGGPIPDDLAAVDALAIVAGTPVEWSARLAARLVADGRVAEGRDLATALGTVASRRGLDALRALETEAEPPLAEGARRLRTHAAIAFGPPLGVALLGPTQLVRDGRLVERPHWRRRRVRELLAFVAHHGTTTRDKVLGALWPDLTDESARRNLRVTLTYLQSVLEPDRARDEPPFYLRLDQDVLTLVGPPHVRLDIRQFDEVVARADATASAGELDVASDAYAEAIALWRGDYLEEFRDAEWAGLAAENARSAALAAFVRAGNVALGAGRTEAAGHAAQRALAVEPWSEDAYRVLVAAHVAAGDRTGAARALDQCDAMLADMGVPADPATDMLRRALHDAAREDREGIAIW